MSFIYFANYVYFVERFRAIQKKQEMNDEKKKNIIKHARYNPNQWFDAKNLKGVEDFREENYKLRQTIHKYKKETSQFKTQMKILEKSNLKRGKQIQALITVALENGNKNNDGMGVRTKKKKRNKKVNLASNNNQQLLLTQLRHEQSIQGSLRNKIKKLKNELKKNKLTLNTCGIFELQQEINNSEIKRESLHERITHYKQQLIEKENLIETIKENEREKLKMQFQVLLDDKNKEIELLKKEINQIHNDLNEEQKSLKKETESKTQIVKECEKLIKELKQSTNFQEIQNEKINQYDEKIKKYDEEIKELKEINSSNKEQINVITLFDEFTQKLYKERNRSIDNIKKTKWFKELNFERNWK